MTKYEALSEKACAQQDYDDEIDLRQLLGTLWVGKWLILAMTILFGAGGVAYALSKPDIYRSSVLLAPANDESGIGGISGQLGGLANLAGINLEVAVPIKPLSPRKWSVPAPSWRTLLSVTIWLFR